MLVLVFLLIIQKDEVMVWHPRGVTKTRIRLSYELHVNFSEFMIKGN